MATCSQLSREPCLKCKEETLHVIDACVHCGRKRTVIASGARSSPLQQAMTIKRIQAGFKREREAIPIPAGDFYET